MLQPISSEKKLVKPLKNCLLGLICAKKGLLWATPKMTNNFLAETTKQDYQFSETFHLSKYHMFWLSYESSSILSDVFCQKSVITKYAVIYIQFVC